jgi:hypothetical protein
MKLSPARRSPRTALACALLSLTPAAALATEAAAAPQTTAAAPAEGTLVAAAQPVGAGANPTSTVAADPEVQSRDSGPASAQALVQRDPVAATKPALAIGSDTFFVAPILAIAGGVTGEYLLVNPNPNKENRVTTAAITRFGAEGRLGPYVTFRSEFERNIRAHGSGIWEGTASMSVRDQVVRLANWGASVEAGIVLDPASVDFFSAHMADLLMADKYARDPLLYSGFNRGQGVQVRYGAHGLTAGLNYSEANPISTSASFMVGGTFGGGNRLFERPLGNFRVGQPDDDFHFSMLSPSLSYEHALFDVKTAVQLFSVNTSANNRVDPNLRGYNGRVSARVKLGGNLGSVPFKVLPFVNASRVENEVANSAAGFADQRLSTHFSAITVSGGVDVMVFERSGVGVHYATTRDRNPTFIPGLGNQAGRETVTRSQVAFLNVGATHWVTDQVALGARFATYGRVAEGQASEQDMSFFTTLRLAL